MVINPETKEVSFIGDEIACPVYGAATTINGNIYGFSGYGKGMVKVNPENNMVIYLRNQQERTKKYNYYQGVPLLAKVDGEMYWISFADSVDVNKENLIGKVFNNG